jgi:hypothetical protein
MRTNAARHRNVGGKLVTLLGLAFAILGCGSAPDDERPDEENTRSVGVEVDTIKTQPDGATGSNTLCVCSGGYRWCRNCSSCGWYKTTTTCVS